MSRDNQYEQSKRGGRPFRLLILEGDDGIASAIAHAIAYLRGDLELGSPQSAPADISGNIDADILPMRRCSDACLTPLEKAEAERQANPEAALKPTEWAKRVGVSARELIRAIDELAIPCQPRGKGRGHAARVIKVDDIIQYLAICEQVCAGERSQPEWWERVRKGVNAHAA